jgi:heme exporter protein D
MTHVGYILAAWLATALVLLGLVAWVALDLRTQKRKLARLEEQGLRRRSEVSR